NWIEFVTFGSTAPVRSTDVMYVGTIDGTPLYARTTEVGPLRTDLENRLRAAREDGDGAPGVGVGEVDGLSQPISVAALRRLCTDVEVIPHVLGGEGETLDLGRSRRLFSPAQRLALVERDGGCAWCHAPPSHCEAHHLRWWDKHHGRTDLSNGLLLCTSCHHRIHRDGWDISVQSGTVWFTPPTSVDSRRQPVLGGRAAVELSRDELSARDRAKNMATA
ncbi:MAG: HNH endonuclease signature motif containing protein, partial [Demequina sp.]